MPFQSEKQRRYLWANEPEIARDWTDTYGSRIEKNDGGIMRTGFFKAGLAAGDNISPGTDTATGGMRDRSQRDDISIRDYKPPSGSHHQNIHGPVDTVEVKKGRKRDQKTKNESRLRKFEKKLINNFVKRNKYKNLQRAGVFGKPTFKGLWGTLLSSVNPPDEVEDFDVGDIKTIASRFGSDLSKTQVKGLEGLRKDLAFTGDTTKEMKNYYGLEDNPVFDNDVGYRGYPSYEAWLAAQNQNTGGTTEVAEVVEDVPSNFQPVSMAQLPYPNYHERRIPAAFGGIMDSSTGRRAYGLGSIFKSIKKAASKVLKSPVGKAALIGGAAYGAHQLGWLGKEGFLGKMFTGGGKYAPNAWNPWKIGIAAAGALPFFMSQPEDEEGDKGANYDVLKNKYADELMRIKAGVSAGSLNPEQWSYLPSNYTYTAAEGGRARLSNGGDPLLREEYDKYVFEMKEMGLTPMSFEEFVAQARAGMYTGGQSIPSDYTMEDAMMTTTQDKLGGITDVMKQADLFRSGDVGQFYAANGGRMRYDAGGQTGHPPITTGQISQLPNQMPGPQTQQPHPMPAPQPNRMAGMPGGMHPMMNPMARGMNPMMARGMNPMMGGRRMAQEGGLMDLGGMEKDYRNDGGFVPIGGEEKADDVPARLSRNEFVFTADAVRGAGGGDIDKGAEIMENVMKNLEEGGQVSEETQGLAGAQEMFGVSERLSEVV